MYALGVFNPCPPRSPLFMNTIRVFCMTHHQVVILGLRTLLDSSPRPMRWVGHHTNPSPRLWSEIQRSKPHVVITDDLFFPVMPEEVPGKLKDLGIGLLVLSMSQDPVEQEALLRAGARGIVTIMEPAGTLLGAIEKVASERLWLPHELADHVVNKSIQRHKDHPPSETGQRIDSLTKREQQIIALLVRHPEAKSFSLGHQLNLSERTVRNRLSGIYRKLGLHGRSALLVFATKHRLSHDIDIS